MNSDVLLENGPLLSLAVTMPTVYIETSIVSYYTSRPSRDLVTAVRQQITREWWETNRLGFETYVSMSMSALSSVLLTN